MSTNIRIVVSAVSELPTVNQQLERLIQLTEASKLAAMQAAQQAAYARADEVRAIKSVQDAINAQSESLKRSTDANKASNAQLITALDEMQRKATSFAQLIGIAFGAEQIKQFALEVIEAKSKMDSFAAGLTTMLGSKREADQLMAELQKLAVTTPFQIDDLQNVVLRLKSMGVATKDLIPDIKMLGDIAAIAGTEKLPLIAKAYTDIMNKGVLMKGEINQLSENGVPIYDLLATSMGKTRAAVVQMAEAHTISFAQVKEALKDATSEGGRYYGMMAVQSQTLAGQTSNLADKFFYAKARIGDFFENGIKGGVQMLSDLIDALAGSSAAIQRTVSTVASATAAWVASRTAVSLYNAQQLIATGQTERLTLAQRLLTINQVEMTAATVSATTTMRGLWAAMVANPIGAIATAVSLAVAAWQGYEAITTDVAAATDESTDKLRTEQAQLNILATQVLGYNEGNERRKDLLALLISKYPDYFAGLSAETLNNAQLKTILDKVNLSYERRIDLARSTYLLEKANKEMQTLWDREDELMMRARQRLSEEMMAQVGNDSAKLLKLLQTNSQAAGMMGTDFKSFMKGLFSDGGLDGFQGMLTSLRQDFTATETKIKTANEAIVGSQKEANKSMLDIEAARHAEALATLKKGTADYQAEVSRHEKNVAGIKDEARAVEFKAQGNHEEKTKTATILTAKQIAAIIKQQTQETYQEQIKALDALEKAEIEAANKRIVSKKASAEDLKAYEEEVAGQILAIHDKYEAKRLEAWEAQKVIIQSNILDQLDGIQQVTDAEFHALDEKKKTEKEKRAESKKTAEEIKKDEEEVLEAQIAAIKETAEIRKQAGQDALQMRAQVVGAAMDMVSSQGGILGALGGLASGIFNTWGQLSGKAREVADENLRIAEQVHTSTKQAYENLGVGTAAQVAETEKNLAKFKANSTASVGEQAMAFMGLAGVAFHVFTAIADAYNESERRKWQATAEAAARTREILKEFTDYSRNLFKENLDAQLSNAKDNYAAQIGLLEAYYDREHELVTSQTRIDDYLGFVQKVAEIRASDMDEDQKAFEVMMTYRAFVEERGLREKLAAIEVEKARLKDLRDYKLEAIQQVYEAEKDRIEKEIDGAKDAFETKKDLIQAERDERKKVIEEGLEDAKRSYETQVNAARTAYDQQVEALNARYDAEKQAIRDTYDLKRSTLEQAKADELEAAGIIDRVRDEVLARYEKTETDKLVAQRDRILASITDETERARITNEFADRIKKVHTDAEQAKQDKSLATKLVSIQLKTEEKQETERLKEEEKSKIVELETQQKNEIGTLKTELKTLLEGYRTDYEGKERTLKGQLVTLENDTKKKIEDLQTQLKNTILGYQNQLRDNELNAAHDKELANRGYTNALQSMNAQAFEANKQIQIVELKVAVAKLRAAGGSGDLIRELNGLIQQLGGQVFDNQGGKPFLAWKLDNGQWVNPNQSDFDFLNSNTDGSGTTKGFLDPEGKETEVFYNPGRKDESQLLTVYRRINGQLVQYKLRYADAYTPSTGKRYAQGTDYVDGPYPAGTDTIPAMLNRGERVLTAEQNRQLGNISNRELVERLMSHRLTIPVLPARLNLPETAGGGLMYADLKTELQLLRQEVRDKKLLQLNIDNGGIAAAMIDQQSKTTYTANRIQF